MSENNTNMSFRALVLVTTPKLSELATEYFKRRVNRHQEILIYISFFNKYIKLFTISLNYCD